MGKELLFSLTKKDFRIDTFRAGGKGGQKQNKTNSGVRVTHLESGAAGECREERSQHVNKERAFIRCVNSDTFKTWHRRKCAELLADRSDVEKKVEHSMREENIRLEVFENGMWKEEE
ncbi:peptide chain release factor-like protein [Alkalihalobacillus clausii]|nr:peptide chain release factor-like protein [Shouchella clausii]MBX0320313.1 peptide chain release factor-like protein [Shouchella clausii]